MAKYRRHLTIDEVPDYWKTDYVISGYCTGGDYKRCLLAAFELHNQTLNAWTKVANAIISIILFYRVSLFIRPPTADLVPFAALTIAVLIHMPFSVGNHLFSGISAEVHRLWLSLDLMFQPIASVLVAFALTWHIYSSGIVIAVNAAVVTALAVQCVREVHCQVMKPHHKYNRLQLLGTFSGLAFLLACPVGFSILRDLAHGTFTLTSAYGFGAWLCYRLGRWIFPSHFPEKYFPGVFDLVGQSHQLMHVALIGANICGYMFVWEAYKQRLGMIK